MSSDALLIERDGAVAIVTFNRPRVRNALNAETLDALRRTMLDLKEDEGVRAVILTGAGDKAFVAGADINELAVQTPTGGREHVLVGQHVFDLVENMGKPVIAAINGYALGGGLELALAADFRVAGERARVGQPEILLGVIPGAGGTQRLSRLLDAAQTGELMGLFQASAAFGSPRDGLRLPDNDFWWTVASCRNGVWGFQAYHHPTDRFANVRFAEKLFGLDNVAVPVNRPRMPRREVEERVTKPMEKLLWEIPGVEYIYSTFDCNNASARKLIDEFKKSRDIA
jgi:hypothetical protein